MKTKPTFDQLPQLILELSNKIDLLISRLPVNIPEKDDPLFTIEELINYLPEKPKRQTVYGWVNFRIIPYKKFGKRLYFKKSEIDSWLVGGRQMQTN